MSELTHAELRLWLGSYVMGSLDPADRAMVDAHLIGCAPCREELASYAALPGLMSRLSVAQVRRPDPAVPPAVLERTLAAVARERGGQVIQLRRWRRAAVLSAAAAVVTGLVLGATLLEGGGTTSAQSVPLVAAAGVSASGSASLDAKPWGTSVTLQLSGLPQGDGFTAWVTASDGRRSIAATWSPTGDGRAAVTGAAAVAGLEVAAVNVVQGERTLLTLTPGPR